MIHFGKNASCGIPIFTWDIVYLVLLGARSLSNLLKILVIRNFYSMLNLYNIASFIIVDGSALAWLIYGNIIFYSHANNCNKVDNS